MSRPQRKKGFRNIVVDGIIYRWKLSAGIQDSRLAVQGSTPTGSQLHVILVGWADPIYHIDGFQIVDHGMYLHSSAKNDPPAITPRFVRQAILFGLSNGWQPMIGGVPYVVRYERGKFAVN